MSNIWQKDKVLLNGWLSIANSFSAEIMAKQGWDCVCIDAQHGMLDFSDAFGMLQAIKTTDAIPLVRIPWLRPEQISKYLDAGCMGLICPMINSVDDVKNFVKWSSYPKQGERSFGPSRVIFENPNYFHEANEAITRLAMIETQQAVENLEQICCVEGLDGLYIGPADLSCAFGYAPALDREEDEMIGLIKTIIATAHKHNKKVGIHTASAAYAKKAIAWGVDMVTISNDVRLLASAAQDILSEMRISS